MRGIHTLLNAATLPSDRPMLTALTLFFSLSDRMSESEEERGDGETAEREVFSIA